MKKINKTYKNRIFFIVILSILIPFYLGLAYYLHIDTIMVYKNYNLVLYKNYIDFIHKENNKTKNKSVFIISHKEYKNILLKNIKNEDGLIFCEMSKDTLQYYTCIINNEKKSIYYLSVVKIDEINKKLNSNYIKIFMSANLIAIFIIIILMIISKRIETSYINPINNLIDATKKIKETDLEFNLEYDGNNELGLLYNAFNEMQHELKKSLNDQWKLEKEKKDLIKAIAHDLKTPISIIRGHSEVLNNSELNNIERNRDYIKTILKNTDKMAKLVGDLNLSIQIESNDFILTPVQIYFPEFICYKKQEYDILCLDKKINFILVYSENINTIYIDAIRIEQIIDNIIVNSIRYSPDNSTISMKIELIENKLFFSISDQGIGFKNDELPFIFEKFYRGDNSRNSSNGNSGLGLYIAKNLVEKHRGSIKAFNNEEGGATIEFIIDQLTPVVKHNNKEHLL